MPTLKELLLGQLSGAVSRGAEIGARSAEQSRDNQLKQLLQGNQIEADKNTANRAPELAGQAEAAKIQASIDALPKVKAVTPSDAGFHVGQVSVTRPANDAANGIKQAGLDLRRQQSHRQLIEAIKKDYDKTIGTGADRLQAARSVQEALQQGNILTLGQLKANLPRLEGEKYRPTDSERKMILTPTGQGMAKEFWNKIAGDSAAISDTQKKALEGLVTRITGGIQGDVDRSKSEVLKRWKSSAVSMNPDELEEVASTLGMSSQQLAASIQEKAAQTQQPHTSAPQAPAGNNDEYAEYQRLKAKHKPGK